MAKNAEGHGLAYVADFGSWSVYNMWINDRVVFEVSVDNDDPTLAIHVAPKNTTHAHVAFITGMDEHKTDGVAFKGTHEVGGTDTSPGDLKDHIDGMSIQKYVYLNLPMLIAKQLFALQDKIDKR